MVSKYPPSYLEGCDEEYEASKATFGSIKKLLIQKRTEMAGDADTAIDELVDEIWEAQGIDTDSDMTKIQTKTFLSEFILEMDENTKISGEAFEQIFKLLDEDQGGSVSRTELQNFIKKFSKNSMV